MKYFLDTEFIESAAGIALVSVGIVCEDGRTFYAECSSFDERLADQWVKDNVLTKLRYWKFESGGLTFPQTCIQDEKNIEVFGSEAYIKTCLLGHFFRHDIDPHPEIYAYFASYDFVVFTRIFGRLIDKPDHFPMWVIDLKQMMWERGLTKEWKQKEHPDPEGEHNSLVDAWWNFGLYNKIILHNPPKVRIVG